MIWVEPHQIERVATSRDLLDRLVNEGKAKFTANLEVRTQVGESFSARRDDSLRAIGPPRKKGYLDYLLPEFRASPTMCCGGSWQVQSDPAPSTPFQYQHTGLGVDGSSMAVDNSILEIALAVEMVGLDTPGGKLTPCLTINTLKSVVKIELDDTARLVGVIPREPQTSAIAPDLSSGGFLVLMMVKRHARIDSL
jgi:hypothetical protein